MTAFEDSTTTPEKYAEAYARQQQWEEVRQPIFAEFLWVFDYVTVSKAWCCRRCVFGRERRCLRGLRQGLQCVAYWHWRQVSNTEQLTMLQALPLMADALQPLSHMELLGIFYASEFTLDTVADFSKQGLRSRLVDIAAYFEEELHDANSDRVR